MPVVSTIRIGHIIRTEKMDYLVRGTIKIRGAYAYVCTDTTGCRVSLNRADVLEAQREGHTTVIAA